MKDVTTKIVLNDKLSPDMYRMRISADLGAFVPGQFVMLRVPSNEVFLRRPFGIVAVEDGECEICYKAVGKATQTMSTLSVGAPVSVMGPLGNGFDIDGKFDTALLVAGGYGIAPIVPLAKELSDKSRGVHVFYGAKTFTDMVHIETLEAAGIALHLTTEDGSRGAKGLVTDALKPALKDAKLAKVFACGPNKMLAAVAKLATDSGVPAELSLEEYMACGLGVCLGCVCKDDGGEFVRVCSEGPVFDAARLDLASITDKKG